MPGPTVAAALHRATSVLARSEQRPSQDAMAEAVASAVDSRRHVIVQAGTGTGKTLAYLVPAIIAGTRCVVSTATKALQDQLAKKDLPLLAEAFGEPIRFAVLKGRSNYICRQRVAELEQGSDQLTLDSGVAAAGPLGREVRRLMAWAPQAVTGDRAELPWEPSAAAWEQVSVGPRDCPGASHCPSGGVCFAETARERAADADVVIVNTSLYATHLAAGGDVLPPHDVVVFDEAHELEDIASNSLGFELAPGRFQALGRLARPAIDDPAEADAVERSGLDLAATLGKRQGERVTPPLPDDLADVLSLARERVRTLQNGLRDDALDHPDAALRARRIRAQQAATHLVGDLDAVMALTDAYVAWVTGPAHARVLKVAPIDVGETLAALLWRREDAPTAICTSATVPVHLAQRIGLPNRGYDELDVGSPFDYRHQALLYCPVHLPDPRRTGYEAAMLTELEALIRAAGGRTMALFTSWSAMHRAADALRPCLPFTILTQSDLPKPALVSRFTEDEASCLFATMGFWQGVDVPGRALSLVTIDRLPFPRPDDPLLEARRERLGPAAFDTIDVPRAATLLAQGAGRLIRTATDRGVVAVLDSRLGRARYRWELVRALPPMARTRRRADVEAFLTSLTATAQ